MKIKNLKWIGLAAAVVFVIVAVFFLQQNGGENREFYQTAHAEQQQFALPEGTHITLNHASELSFRKNLLGDERRVFLQGQAFFDVFNDGRPFVVETENAEIRLINARFDVRARAQKTRVVVEEGEVSVATLPNGENVSLEANQITVVRDDDAPAAAAEVNVPNFIAWRAKKLVFDDVALGEIAAEMERAFNVQIWLDGGVDQERLKLVVEDQPVHQVLTSIALTLDLIYELKEGVHMLSAR